MGAGVKYYDNLARMNLLMNDVSYDRMTLKNADTRTGLARWSGCTRN